MAAASTPANVNPEDWPELQAAAPPAKMEPPKMEPPKTAPPEEEPEVQPLKPGQHPGSGAPAAEPEDPRMLVGPKNDRKRWVPDPAFIREGLTPKFAPKGKTLLVEYAQRLLYRTCNAHDVTYKVEKDGEEYTATVFCKCLEGKPEYVGEPKTDKLEAEQSAAKIAVDDLYKKMQLKFPAITRETPDATPKNYLLEAVALINHRCPWAEDIKSEFWDMGNETFIAKISLPYVSGDINGVDFSGQASPFRRDALISACQVCLDALLKDPQHKGKFTMEKVKEKEAFRREKQWKDKMRKKERDDWKKLQMEWKKQADDEDEEERKQREEDDLRNGIVREDKEGEEEEEELDEDGNPKPKRQRTDDWGGKGGWKGGGWKGWKGKGKGSWDMNDESMWSMMGAMMAQMSGGGGGWGGGDSWDGGGKGGRRGKGKDKQPGFGYANLNKPTWSQWECGKGGPDILL